MDLPAKATAVLTLPSKRNVSTRPVRHTKSRCGCCNLTRSDAKPLTPGATCSQSPTHSSRMRVHLPATSHSTVADLTTGTIHPKPLMYLLSKHTQICLHPCSTAHNHQHCWPAAAHHSHLASRISCQMQLCRTCSTLLSMRTKFEMAALKCACRVGASCLQHIFARTTKQTKSVWHCFAHKPDRLVAR